jgi:hypothetical protein
LQFSLTAWAACAPGLHEPQAWLAWARQPHVPTRQGLDSDVPALVELPAMARRRLSPLGRMAVQAAWWCQDAPMGGANQAMEPSHRDATYPVVFASRHGDTQRTLELQDALAAGQAMSPTAFGLSVHNAISAQYSIARGDRGNYIAVAAGAASAAAGLLEATSLLADGAPEVLLVCHEEGVPLPYDRYVDRAESTGPSMAWAWAWRLGAASAAPAGAARFTLSLAPADDLGQQPPSPDPRSAPCAVLPLGLDLLRYALTDEACWTREVDGQRWTLRRQGGPATASRDPVSRAVAAGAMA